MARKKRESLIIFASFLILALALSVHALADRLVDASEPVIISDDIRNAITEVVSSADGATTSEMTAGAGGSESCSKKSKSKSKK